MNKKVFLSRYIWIYFTKMKNSGEPNYKYAIYLREMWSRHNKSRMSWFISFLPKPVLIHFTFEDNLIENFKCFSVTRILWYQIKFLWISQNIWYVIGFYSIACLIPQTTNKIIVIDSYTYFYFFNQTWHIQIIYRFLILKQLQQNCNIQSENEYVNLE